MQLNFLRLPAEERAMYFEQAAHRRQLSPVMMEKDFWVCWMLGVLFDSTFRHALVFKGGTSLLKVYGVIQRFSEDIDLSLSPEFLGLRDVEDTASLTRNQAGKWMKEAETACGLVIRERIRPELEMSIAGVLGERSGSWLEFDTDPTTHSPVLNFHYPTTQTAGFEYLKRSVKLEFGSLTDQQPIGSHPVRPWMADEIPQTFEDWNCKVVSLEVERTFWEKATILHSECHREEGKPTPSRFSRHYADMAALAVHPVASRAVERHDLRERVVQWKSRFFASGWARYDLARPGTFRLVPPATRLTDLRRDYAAMQDMYPLQPTDFEEVMTTLTGLETRINLGR